MAKHRPVEYGELRHKMVDMHSTYHLNGNELDGTTLIDALDEIGEDGWKFAFEKSERLYFQRYVDEDY